jgi:hypothetical protein
MSQAPDYLRAIVATCLAGTLLFSLSCRALEQAAEEKPVVGSTEILFEDSMTEDWQKQWFLDGEKADLRHSEDGLHFTATTLPGI